MKEQDSGEKYLAAYIVSDKELSKPGVKAYLSGQVPGYMMPSYYIELDEIPLTSSGKVDLTALPEPGIDVAGDSYTLPQNEIQSRLVDIWANLLEVEKEKIGIDTNFFEIGGHSLKATVMVSGIHKMFNIKIALPDLFKSPTIRALSGLIGQSGKTNFIDLEKNRRAGILSSLI